jgi:hypothetical protein
MSYSFQPMTEQELNANKLVEDGTYEFYVIRSTRKISKAMNSMCELNIRFWDKEGKIHTLFDYLVFSNVPLNIKKVKHFCDAVGLIEEYKVGQIPEELGGYSGKFKIFTQIGQEIPKDKLQGKPPGSKYPDKNAVEDYVVTEKSSVKYSSETDKFQDDGIPF